MRMAVLADIHGNSWALAAVLEHARGQGAERMCNLGDTYYGPLDPAGTWELLAGLDMPAVAGNQDRLLLEAAPGANPTLDAVRAALPLAAMHHLQGLPAVRTEHMQILMCHGTPADDSDYLLEDVSTGAPRLRSIAAIEARLMGLGQGVVLCGHSHIPHVVRTGRRLLVNPGSVGLPAYTDDDPPHAMSCGTPHARYAMLAMTRDGWDATLHEVEYDWDHAARRAREAGREDWAACLATGLAPAA